MGIALDIFSLYGLRAEDGGCVHHLLVRVGRRGFSNADEGDYTRADEAADERRRALVQAYEGKTLSVECGARHAATLVGELQARPVGDELSGRRGGFHVALRVAETRFGRPWVVLGTARDEETFWREAAADEDLSRLGATPPARRLRAYFLAEEVSAAGGDG